MRSCLFRYIASAVHKPESALVGHSAEWESWCLYHILVGMGYQVDTIDWKQRVSITKQYGVVFDAINLTELKLAFKSDTIKIVHLTGADNVWRNRQGEKRLVDMNTRRGCRLSYRRSIADPTAVYKSIEIADYCTLIGNDWTRRTYPERYWDKIHLVNVTASR